MRFVCLLISTVFIFSCAPPDEYQIFISEKGSDEARGTKNAPLGSLQAAVEKIRAYLDAGGKKNMVINVTGGTYRLERSVDLGELPLESETQTMTIRGDTRQVPHLVGQNSLPVLSIQGKEHTPAANIILDNLAMRAGNHENDVRRTPPEKSVEPAEMISGLYVKNAQNITVKNCRLENFPGPGIVVHGFGRRITVSHNLVTNCQNAGIVFKSQVAGQAGLFDNHIFCNKISYIQPAETPSGAISFSGPGQNNRIEYNLVRNLRSPKPVLFAGVYIGGQSNGISVQNNIFTGFSGRNMVPLFVGGSENLIHNNIFANNKCGDGYVVYYSGVDSTQGGHVFTRNILYNNHCEALFFLENWHPARVAKSDSNLFYHYSPRFRVLGIPHGELLQHWVKEAGYDQNSRIIDPRFVGPNTRDFSFKRDSPAPAMGFIPIDIDSIGPSMIRN